MKGQTIASIQALLEDLPEPQLLFTGNTLAAINACARGLLPESRIGDQTQTIFGEDMPDFDGFSLQETLLFSAKISGTTMGVQLTPYQKQYRLARLVPTQDTMYAEAMRSIAESMGAPMTNIQVAKAKLFPKLEETEDSDALTWAAQMNRGIYAILRIIGNLRLLGDPEALTDTCKKRTNVTQWLEQVTQRLEPLMRDAQRDLVVELPKQAVYCDIHEDLLQRAILNVISNSVKYTELGGHIVFRAEKRDPGRLMITIEDDGCGVSGWAMQNMEQLFRARPQISDGRNGAGVGLYMARRILEDHGGRLFMAFDPKSGTTVYMQLSTVSRPDRDVEVRTSSQLLDRSGGYDLFLQELADVLPDWVFDPRDVN
jgi:signal transduction histidine kinase